jgi:outer membrane murein-binding lipoprotein Lpp
MNFNKMNLRHAILFSALMTTFAGTAAAQENDLSAQIKALTAKLEELQKKVDAQKIAAQSSFADVIKSEAVTKGDFPGSFKIPGTETSVKIGGVAKLVLVKDFNGGESGAVGLVATTPLSNKPQADREGQFSLNARQSRLFVRTQTPTPMGDLVTHVEGDFYGAGGTESITNSAGFRLRHAYAEVGPWLAGQTWTNFVDLATAPEVIDFSGGHGNAPAIRAAQLRYTKTIDDTQKLSFSIENPLSDIQGTTAPTYAAGLGPTSSTTISKSPDFVLKYVKKGTWGSIAGSGVVRRLTLNNIGGTAINGFTGEKSETTSAWHIESVINTIGKDTIQLHYLQGTGVGRYALSANPVGSAAIYNNQLEGIDQKAYAIGYRHFWTPSLRSNIVFGRVKADLSGTGISASTVNDSKAVFANLLWSPYKNTTLGIEFQQARVRNDNGDDGKNNRILSSVEFAF